MKYARLLQIFFKIWPQDNEVEPLYNFPINIQKLKIKYSVGKLNGYIKTFSLPMS